MKKTLLLLLAAVSSVVSKASDSLSVFFVGNSQTYYYDMPAMLKAYAASAGDYVYTEQQTPGGEILFYHYGDDIVEDKVSNGSFDYVILQEQSQIPVIPEWREQSMFWGSKMLYEDIIQKNCSKLAFYETIGYKDGGKQCSPDNKYCSSELVDYYQYQDTVNWAYQTIADSLGGLLFPIGVAAKAVKTLKPSFDLWASDGRHPGVTGSYLGVAVMYASLFKKSPKGVSYYSTLDSATAHFLQHIADSIVFSDTAKWNWSKQEQALQEHFQNVVDQPISVIGDTAICQRGDILVLAAPQGFEHYLWSTGETLPYINVSDTGIYSVSGACKSGLTFNITQKRKITYKKIIAQPELVINSNPAPDTIWLNAINDSVIVNVAGDFYYWEWNDAYTGSHRTIKDPGIYYIHYAVDPQTDCISAPSDTLVVKKEQIISSKISIQQSRPYAYPNPTDDMLYINTESTPSRIELISLSGFTIDEIINSKSISVKNLSKGTYLIRYSVLDEIYVELFIKK